MRDPVEITLRGIPHSAALERYVGEQARQLDRQCELIQACHVVVEALQRHRQQGAQIAVRLNITLPGTEVVVNREHGEDVYIALHDAFEAAGLQLKDHMRRQSNIEHRSRNGAPHPRR
ncbi:MAG TPA: HPF/RaiA family ribosome-associated protein [Burkholderiales bacterium]